MNLVRIMSFRIGVLLLAVLIASSVLAALLSGCGGGTQADKMSIEEVWSRAGNTEKKVNSEHMEMAIYYENTKYGGGQMQSLIIDISGDDFHLQNLLFGTVVSEDIRVNGKSYSKQAGKNAWTEVQAVASDNSTSEVISQFLQLPAMASSQERLGKEMLGDLETQHYRFILSPEAAVNMFPPTPPADFSSTSGGEVDVWITTDDFNMVRYELVIRNVKITDEIGTGDIRFLVNIRDINKPIDIKPPS
ncbi:MAG: hypothetical protein A2V52_07580 [Actinobacteria bacterium RBG_19FT_COMBO_54_7]|nr:MAG: hypothetical protein A2V52_07580 [Actinobacteria bacterium RBG_19FT_COMBO_54_7]